MSLSNTSSNQPQNYASPCSLAGAVCALAGIDGIDILVNGPSSCTGFTTGLVDGGHPIRERNSPVFSRIATGGLPRIPCSEITDADVILGIGDKLTHAVETLAVKRSCERIAIINSCSLSLIGEDATNILKDHALADRILYLESTGCSKSSATGHNEAMIQLIDRLARPQTSPQEKTVNLLGLSIVQYGWKHDLAEMQRLLDLAGIRLNTALAAGCSLDAVRGITDAALNVVVNPDYGLEIARFMESRYGTPYIAAPRLPIGFEPTYQFMADLLAVFDLAMPAALEAEARRCRREAVLALSHSPRSDLLRGLPVAVFGEWSFVSGLACFLEQYLGCAPVILGIEGKGEVTLDEITDWHDDKACQTEILLNPDAGQKLAAIKEKRPVILFGSTFEEYLLAQAGYAPAFFVQTTGPGFQRVNLVHRPYIGFAGVLTFVEAMLNCRLTERYPYTEI